MVRSPPTLRATTEPPVATSMQGSSAAASAWAMLPPTVPRLRMTMCATLPSTSAIRGFARRTASSRSRSRWRVIAPTLIDVALDRARR